MQYILLILCLIQLAAIVWLVMQVQKLRRPQDDTALRTLRQEIAADALPGGEKRSCHTGDAD